MPNKKVCVIGAGPSGMSFMCWAAKFAREGRKVPEVTCFEKQSEWGGLWNYSWRTGTDENGEPVHGSMYRYLWSNGPKECLELPHYTFEDHYKGPIPSFPPREVLFDYLQGRWRKEDVKRFIHFNTIVKDVVYNKETDNFSVVVKDLKRDRVLSAQEFDYVIVATGHYSVPNVPSFPGVEKFPGRVMHAHDFRDATEFADKTLLLVGASYSAEDIALQCIKYGAKRVICTWRSKPMGFKWPESIEERPLVQKFVGKTAHFKDGSEHEVDVVMFCTGYLHSYPFLRDELRLKSKNVLYPPNLYKGMVWMEGGNDKLFYAGVQDQYYTFTMFDIVGLWLTKHLIGEITLPDHETMDKQWRPWVFRNQKLADCHEEINFQTDYVMDLVKECGKDYPYNLDVGDIFHAWEHHKDEDVLTYRDQSFPSKFTGTPSPIHLRSFMEALDDTLETFMNKIKK